MHFPRYSSEYINGVEYFLNYAYTKGNPQGGEILCPCTKCHNDRWKTRRVVFDHLIGNEFEKGYDVWLRHGEGLNLMDLDEGEDVRDDTIDDIDKLLNEWFRDVAHEEFRVNEGLNEDAKKFYNLIEEAKQELYPGCKIFSTLSFTIRLYLLKCLHGWSNASFTSLLELLREAMPMLKVPDSFNKAKGMIRELGLDYKKIDACPNDCMLYWKDHENDTSCHVSGYSRWIENSLDGGQLEEDKKVHKRASNEDGELPTQAELSIETRQSKKGKQLDEETNNAIIKLQDSIENEGQSSTEAFQTMFGKEKPERVRCYGRTTTSTILKKNMEIVEIEKRHADEVKHLNDKVQGMEVEHAEMEQKFQLLLKTMINQDDLGMNVEALVSLLSTPYDANSVLRSSTSTHAPNNHELTDDEMDEDQLLDNFEDLEDDDKASLKVEKKRSLDNGI